MKHLSATSPTCPTSMSGGRRFGFTMPPTPSWKDSRTLGAGLDMMSKADMLIAFTGQDNEPYLLRETSSLMRTMSSYQQLTTCCLRGRMNTSISLSTTTTTMPNRKQELVTLSTAEAEYITATHAAKELALQFHWRSFLATHRTHNTSLQQSVSHHHCY